jgi:hypothetical protein
MDKQTLELVAEVGFDLAEGIAGDERELHRLRRFVELLGKELKKLVAAEDG